MVTLNSVQPALSPGKYSDALLCSEAAKLNLGKSPVSAARKSLPVPRPKYFHWNRSDPGISSPSKQQQLNPARLLRQGGSSGRKPRKLDFSGAVLSVKRSSDRNSGEAETSRLRLRCEVCQIQSSSASKLERHRRLHQTLEKSQGGFRCLQCRKSFNQLAKLLIHKYSHNKLRHSGVCNLCRARYQDIASHHQRSHIQPATTTNL